MSSEGKKRSYIWLLIAAVVGGVLLFGWHYFFRGDTETEFEREEVVRGEFVGKVSATGSLESITKVTVGSQVSGPVAEVLVDFNSHVKAGDVLAKIDPSEFEARLAQSLAGLESAQAGLQNAQATLSNAEAGIAQARAQVTSARANVEQSRSQVNNAEASVKNAEAAIARAQAEMDNALIQFQRSEKLYKRELIAASELDQARTTYRVQAAAYQTALAGKTQALAGVRQSGSQVDASKGDLKAAETRLQAALAQRESASAQIASAQAQVSQAHANAEQARVDLQRTIIRSPIDGIVIERKVDPGQTVAAAFQAPELFIIAEDLREMQVRVDVSEADIGRVKMSQPVSFTVDAYPDRQFEGKITQVRSAPTTTEQGAQSSNVVVYGVLVSVVNDDQSLKPGLTATVEIETERLPDSLMIANSALRFVPPEDMLPEEEKKDGKKSRGKRNKKDKDKKSDKSEEDPKKKKKSGRRGSVWVEGAKGLEKRNITVGLSNDSKTLVLDGDLKEGEEVLTGIAMDEEGGGGRRRMRIRL